MRMTLELAEADEALLRRLAQAQGVSEAEYLLGLLRKTNSIPPTQRSDFPRINTGGFTEAAMKLDMRKSGWWEELEDEGHAA